MRPASLRTFVQALLHETRWIGRALAPRLVMRKPSAQSPSVDALDPCADSAEFFFDAFVTAIDVVDAVDVSCILRHERRQHKRCAGTQIGCRDGRSAKPSGAGNDREVAVD